MWNRKWAASAAFVMASSSAFAETPAKPDAAASVSADSAAAMERAKRQAAGPMRFILEAAKGRRKAGDADTPAPAPVEAVVVRPVATRSVAVSPPVSEPVVRTSAPAPVLAVVEPPAQARALSPVLTEITLASQALQAKPVAVTVPGLERTALATPAAAIPAAALSLPSLVSAPLIPQLVSQGDVELSVRALDEVSRGTVVQVDLKLRTDGSVADVKLISSVPRPLARELIPMLQQWRFRPLPREHVHRVEVLLNVQ